MAEQGCTSGGAPEVDLGDLCQDAGARAYALRSMVCFHGVQQRHPASLGGHYVAYVWSSADCAWLLFDDAMVSRVGTWAAVRNRIKGEDGPQPSMLFFGPVLQ